MKKSATISDSFIYYWYLRLSGTKKCGNPVHGVARDIYLYGEAEDATEEEEEKEALSPGYGTLPPSRTKKKGGPEKEGGKNAP